MDKISFEKLWTIIVNSNDISFVISIISLFLTVYSISIVRKVEKAVYKTKKIMSLKVDSEKMQEDLSSACESISQLSNPHDIRIHFMTVYPHIINCIQGGILDKATISEIATLEESFTSLEKGETHITGFELQTKCMNIITCVRQALKVEV